VNGLEAAYLVGAGLAVLTAIAVNVLLRKRADAAPTAPVAAAAPAAEAAPSTPRVAEPVEAGEAT
jgi:hypothetical protein